MAYHTDYLIENYQSFCEQARKEKRSVDPVFVVAKWIEWELGDEKTFWSDGLNVISVNIVQSFLTNYAYSVGTQQCRDIIHKIRSVACRKDRYNIDPAEMQLLASAVLESLHIKGDIYKVIDLYR